MSCLKDCPSVFVPEGHLNMNERRKEGNKEGEKGGGRKKARKKVISYLSKLDEHSSPLLLLDNR